MDQGQNSFDKWLQGDFRGGWKDAFDWLKNTARSTFAQIAADMVLRPVAQMLIQPIIVGITGGLAGGQSQLATANGQAGGAGMLGQLYQTGSTLYQGYGLAQQAGLIESQGSLFSGVTNWLDTSIGPSLGFASSTAPALTAAQTAAGVTYIAPTAGVAGSGVVAAPIGTSASLTAAPAAGMTLTGAMGAGGAVGGIVGGQVGTATNSKLAGAGSGAASGAAVGAMFGPWGAAIGALAGALLGALGTAKKSVGPNGGAAIGFDPATGMLRVRGVAGDNGYDTGPIAQEAQQLVADFNQTFAAYGIRAANLGARSIGNVQSKTYGIESRIEGGKGKITTADYTEAVIRGHLLESATADPVMTAILARTGATTLDALRADLEVGKQYNTKKAAWDAADFTSNEREQVIAQAGQEINQLTAEMRSLNEQTTRVLADHQSARRPPECSQTTRVLGADQFLTDLRASEAGYLMNMADAIGQIV